MNKMATIETDQLYKKVVKMNLPYYQWHNWIENYLNKELMRAALRINRKKGNMEKPQNKTFVKTEALTKSTMLA